MVVKKQAGTKRVEPIKETKEAEPKLLVSCSVCGGDFSKGSVYHLAWYCRACWDKKEAKARTV